MMTTEANATPNSGASSAGEIKVLLSCRNEATKFLGRSILELNLQTFLKLTQIDVLQEAIASLEKDPTQFDLVIFDHNSPELDEVKKLLDAAKATTFIMTSADANLIEGLRDLENTPDFLLQTEFEAGFLKLVKRLSAVGKIPPLPITEGDYVNITERNLLAMSPLKYDVYVRMAGGRFVRLFTVGLTLSAEDLAKYNKKQVVDFFFVKRADSEAIMREQAAAIEKLNSQPNISQADAKKQYAASIASVRDVVNNVGFTPAAQDLAKSCVAMSIKALSSKPSLSSILSDLQSKDADYIVSHSMMVGQIACAMAAKIGWHSPATYFKLSLAGFMHDISLEVPEMAHVESLEVAEKEGKLTKEQLHAIKLHTVKAADYSKQFTEIPSDVDLILAQHHERPDGSGFPRKMHGKIISPLSALFIMAHDLVHAVYENPKTNIDTFFEERAEVYQHGQFKKILVAMKQAAAAG